MEAKMGFPNIRMRRLTLIVITPAEKRFAVHIISPNPVVASQQMVRPRRLLWKFGKINLLVPVAAPTPRGTGYIRIHSHRFNLPLAAGFGHS